MRWILHAQINPLIQGAFLKIFNHIFAASIYQKTSKHPFCISVQNPYTPAIHERMIHALPHIVKYRMVPWPCRNINSKHCPTYTTFPSLFTWTTPLDLDLEYRTTYLHLSHIYLICPNWRTIRDSSLFKINSFVNYSQCSIWSTHDHQYVTMSVPQHRIKTRSLSFQAFCSIT